MIRKEDPHNAAGPQRRLDGARNLAKGKWPNESRAGCPANIFPRRKFLETYCDTSTLCFFAHFPSPSRGYVKRWGEGFRCEYLTD
jgi:hypothetical protein